MKNNFELEFWIYQVLIENKLSLVETAEAVEFEAVQAYNVLRTTIK